MTVGSYIRQKNSIIKKYTGLVLVPEDQIVDIPAEQVGELSLESDAHACPYCVNLCIHNTEHMESDCAPCPMYKAGNYCNASGSSFRALVFKASHITHSKAIWLPELTALINQYNNELKEH